MFFVEIVPLVLREAMFGTVASLIPLFFHSQYRNIGKGCEGILPQSNDLHNSRKLRKVSAIYKVDKLMLSKSSVKKVREKGWRLGKNNLLKK